MLVLSLLLACGPKRAERRLPHVDAIFEASIEAAGGRAAMMAHDNVISRGRVTTSGAELTLTVYHAAPSTLYTTLEIPGVGVISTGYTDGLAWELNPIMGPRILQGDEAAQEARRADFHATLNYAVHYPERSLVGRSVFEETPVWEVTAVTSLGDEETLYFDIDTGLMRGSKKIIRTETGAMVSTTVFDEHREIDGIRLPVVMTQSSGGVDVTIHLDAVHYDVESMPDLAPPPAVMELVAQGPGQ